MPVFALGGWERLPGEMSWAGAGGCWFNSSAHPRRDSKALGVPNAPLLAEIGNDKRLGWVVTGSVLSSL